MAINYVNSLKKYIYTYIVAKDEIDSYEKDVEQEKKKKRYLPLKERVRYCITCRYTEVRREQKEIIKFNKTRNSFESIVFGFQLPFEVLLQVYF